MSGRVGLRVSGRVEDVGFGMYVVVVAVDEGGLDADDREASHHAVAHDRLQALSSPQPRHELPQAMHLIQILVYFTTQMLFFYWFDPIVRWCSLQKRTD